MGGDPSQSVRAQDVGLGQQARQPGPVGVASGGGAGGGVTLFERGAAAAGLPVLGQPGQPPAQPVLAQVDRLVPGRAWSCPRRARAAAAR